MSNKDNIQTTLKDDAVSETMAVMRSLMEAHERIAFDIERGDLDQIADLRDCREQWREALMRLCQIYRFPLQISSVILDVYQSEEERSRKALNEMEMQRFLERSIGLGSLLSDDQP